MWYDTMLGDWVVRLPVRPGSASAVLPLSIPFYDARPADVYRTAADLAYADVAFDDAV